MNQQIVECNAIYSDGERFGFEIEADFNESSSNIRIRFPMLSDEWESTPYQVADARHKRIEAAKLAWDSQLDNFMADDLADEVDLPIGFEVQS